MRILIIGMAYAPEVTGIAPYTAGLAEHLAAKGYSAVAVTGLPSFPEWRVHTGYRHLLWKHESINGVDVHRRWHYVPGRQSAIRRGLYEATFFLTGLSALMMPRPDAVLGIVPSLSGGVLARLAGWRFRVPYGLIFQDLTGQAAEQSGVKGGAYVARGVRAVEGWAARGAAAMGIVAEGFRPYLESLGVDAKRIHRVRNWSRIDAPSLDRSDVRERFGLPEDAILCLHAGNMGHKQGLENVIECARLAAGQDGRLLFLLIGDGNRRRYLEALVGQYKLSNVRFLPIQPDNIFPSILAAADILLVNQRGSVCDMSLASKLTSYLTVGKPLVAAVQPASETAREIVASGGGLTVAPDAPSVLLEALQKLADDADLRVRMGQSAQTWSATELSKQTAMDDYLSLLSHTVSANGHSSERANDLKEETMCGQVTATRRLR